MGICLSCDDKRIPKKGTHQGKAAGYLAIAKDVQDLRFTSGYSNLTIFSYNELRAATKNFRSDEILGEGGFGIVYKGYIDESIKLGFKHIQVAVKELNRDGFQGDQEWLAEVNYLGQLSHPNLVKLIGYCCEGTHRLLVYEYLACGSLERHLFRRGSTLSWYNRVKIALGAAKGLAFLHVSERPIIYRDFKTSNILLDADYNPKLSDFGLAKLGPMGDETHVSTRVMGTFGYAAPEYVMTGHLTAKSDVYGFGVVLLELLLGKRAMDRSRPSHKQNLVEWARPLLVQNRKLLRAVDQRLEGQYTKQAIVEVAGLAYLCLSQNPRGRPTMSEVVENLEDLLDVPQNKVDLMFRSYDGTITLYEAPKDTLDRYVNERDNEPQTHYKRRPMNRNRRGRTNSEPYVNIFPSPDIPRYKSVKRINSDY